MKKNYKFYVSVVLLLSIFLLFTSFKIKKKESSAKVKNTDSTQYASVLALDKSFFTDIQKNDKIIIKTKKSTALKNPKGKITKPKLKFVFNDKMRTPLSNGIFSENADFDKNALNAVLAKADQTTVYTFSTKEIENLKEKGLLILGYGAEATRVEISCIDYSPLADSGIDTKSSAKSYFASNYTSGWNLGNYLDTIASGKNRGFSSSENWSKAEASPELFKNLRNHGFDFVRIPITYVSHLGSAPDYKINDDWLSYIKKVVDMALAENFGVLINIHHDGSGKEQWLNISAADDNEENYINQTVQFCQIWAQVANMFRDYGSNLAFEGFNEVQDGKWGWGDNRSDDGVQYSIVNKWNQAFVSVVRATGGNNVYRYLGLNGYCAAPELLSYMDIPEDFTTDNVNRFAVSFHYYSPFEFGIEGSVHKWGADFGNVPAKETTNGSQEKFLMKTFDKVVEIFNDYAIYIGEYGATYQGKKYSDYQRYYLEFLVQHARKNGMLVVLWDNNAESTGRESFGYIDRKTGKVRKGYEDFIKAVQRASVSDKEDYKIEPPKMQ